MMPFVVRLVVHFGHHLANRRAWQAVLFEQPREQRRDGERRQKIRQFHLAHLKNHQRDGAGDQPGGGVDGICQLAGFKKRLGVKLAGQGDDTEQGKNRNRGQCRRPAEHFHEAGHRQPVHHALDGEQIKIAGQSIRHRAQYSI